MKKITKNSEKIQRGFTLIELILYIAILTIILSAIIPFAWSVIESGTKSTTEQEVYSQTRFISERIKYEIRRASNISTVTPTSLTLTNFLPDTTTVIASSGGKITINKNGTGAVNLNSNNTTVTNLIFTSFTSSDKKTENTQFTLTLNAAFGSKGQIYTETTTVTSSAELRSN